MKFHLLISILLLTFQAVSSNMRPPYIRPPGSHSLVVGANLEIVCEILMDENITFNWIWPNSDATYKATRSQRKFGKDAYQISTLQITDVTLRDSGWYICEASDSHENRRNYSRKIDIKDAIAPYINVKATSEILIKEGEQVRWRAVISAYPPDPHIIYRNYKNDVINESATIKVEAYERRGKLVSWLKFENVTATDFGNYTIEVVSKDGSIKDSSTVYIEVQSKPNVSMDSFPPSVAPEEPIEITCTLMGWDIPKVELTFRKCPTGPRSCSSPEKIVLDSSNESFPEPGNIRKVIGSFLPTSSGFLTCRGNNIHGENSSTHSVSINDIGGNFVFKHIGPDNTTKIKKGEGRFILELIENDKFYLQCGVAKFSYGNVDLSGQGMEVKEKNSEHSQVKYIESDKVTSAFGGIFTCKAECLITGVTETREIEFRVKKTVGHNTLGKLGVSLASISIIILAVIIFSLVRRVKKERKFRKIFRRRELYLFKKGNIGQLNPDCTADEQAELLPYSPEWEVKREDISLGKQLGAGAFGKVVKAVVTDLCDYEPKTTVALKMCKSQADQSQIYALTRELKVMIHLGKHLNIVNLMGANTVDVGKGELWILVEYCRYGNLLTFMHRHRKNFINQINPVTGKIDPLKTVQDVTSPLSPTSQGPRFGNQPINITEKDGVMSPTQSKFNLYSAPPGRNPSSPSCSAASVTGSSNGISSVDRPPQEYPDNPLYKADSSNIRNIGVDSQGKPFTFDTGYIPGINAPFTTSGLVCWGWQIAQGMDYLMQRKVLHGDLSAQNLLLADNNVVKISDFGLSRDIYKKDIYMKSDDDLMAIKWLSIEAIRDRIFSVQSDVWAYGVTLWELFTLGSTPYPGIEVNKDLLTFLEDGNRMDRPKYANQEIYNIILDCWRTEPQERPTFSVSAQRLGVLMLTDIKDKYITMNDPYMLMNEERFKNETDYLSMLSNPDFDNLNRKDNSEKKGQTRKKSKGGGGRNDC